jgi:hypothetical protein
MEKCSPFLAITANQNYINVPMGNRLKEAYENLKRARGKRQHSCFLKVVYIQTSGVQVSLVKMSCTSLRTVVPPLCYHWV